MWSLSYTDHRPGVYLCIGGLHLPKEEHRPGLVERVFVGIEPEERQYDFSILLPQRELGGVTHSRRGDSLQPTKEGRKVQLPAHTPPTADNSIPYLIIFLTLMEQNTHQIGSPRSQYSKCPHCLFRGTNSAGELYNMVSTCMYVTGRE